MTEIQKALFELRDEKYREFSGSLMPTVEPDRVIGVRTPDLRKLAKKLAKEPDADAFLHSLPHTYFEENQLHGFMIEEIRDFETCVQAMDAFLPYIDNWATCDQVSPKVFKKHLPELLDKIREWIASERVYTVRFGIGMLMEHYLDEAFSPEYPEIVCSVKSEEYYVNMMIAWYFATALAKQYDTAVLYIEQKRLEVWTHNKAIQKSIESRRITEDKKKYLRSLKRKA